VAYVLGGQSWQHESQQMLPLARFSAPGVMEAAPALVGPSKNNKCQNSKLGWAHGTLASTILVQTGRNSELYCGLYNELLSLDDPDEK
jgi:hypothetical protein